MRHTVLTLPATCKCSFWNLIIFFSPKPALKSTCISSVMNNFCLPFQWKPNLKPEEDNYFLKNYESKFCLNHRIFLVKVPVRTLKSKLQVEKQ